MGAYHCQYIDQKHVRLLFQVSSAYFTLHVATTLKHILSDTKSTNMYFLYTHIAII